MPAAAAAAAGPKAHPMRFKHGADHCGRADGLLCPRIRWLGSYSGSYNSVPGFMKIYTCLFAQPTALKASRHTGCSAFFQKMYRHG